MHWAQSNPMRAVSSVEERLDRDEPMFPPPITSRPRLLVTELASALVRFGLRAPTEHELESMLAPFLPPGRFISLTTQGKAAFELVIRAAGLAGTTVIFPAFFPDDFVGLFRKYAITPRFVDVERDSYEINAALLTDGVLAGASALVVEHSFGRPANATRLREICDRSGLLLIEDCARALGAGPAGHLAGTDGDYAIYSLSKVAPVRHGGIVLSRTPIEGVSAPPELAPVDLLASMLLLRVPLLRRLEGPVYRFAKETALYPFEIGNYDPLQPRRLDAVARLALAAFLPRYDGAVRAQVKLAERIRGALEPYGFRFQTASPGHIFTSLAAEVPPGLQRDEARRWLREQGVKAAFMWDKPLGTSPLAAAEWGVDTDAFPVTAHLARTLLQLPISRLQSEDETQRVIDACMELARANGAVA